MTSIINVQVDSKDKELANEILKDLGLNMSTFINMAIKQVIKRNGVPFDIVNPEPSEALKEALKEANMIEKEIKDGKRKGYSSVQEMLGSIVADD